MATKEQISLLREEEFFSESLWEASSVQQLMFGWGSDPVSSLGQICQHVGSLRAWSSIHTGLVLPGDLMWFRNYLHSSPFIRLLLVRQYSRPQPACVRAHCTLMLCDLVGLPLMWRVTCCFSCARRINAAVMEAPSWSEVSSGHGSPVPLPRGLMIDRSVCKLLKKNFNLIFCH